MYRFWGKGREPGGHVLLGRSEKAGNRERNLLLASILHLVEQKNPRLRHSIHASWAVQESSTRLSRLALLTLNSSPFQAATRFDRSRAT